MYGELSQTALKCNFIEYDNSLTAIYVRSISAAFFYAGKFAASMSQRALFMCGLW
jgi:hypothetical protein